jgi:Ice-binding-like
LDQTKSRLAFTSSFISRNAGQQQMLTQHIRISTISTSNRSVDCTDVVLDQITKEKKMNRFKHFTKPLMWFMALLLVGLVAGCGGGSGTPPPPPKPAPTAPGAGTGAGAGGHGPAPVIMGSIIGTGAANVPNFAILAETTITTTGTTAVTGDLGLSPNKAIGYTGFNLILPAGGSYSTSGTAGLVTGNIYAPDYASPTPALLTKAVGDMLLAYKDAAGRPADFTEIGAGNIGGMTLPAGTYKWGGTVVIPTNVTLSGGANDVWIFQIAGGITQASAVQVQLTGGAVAKNVFWVVADVVSINTTALMQGVILAQTQINLYTGATVNGRLLAQTQVTLQSNAVTVK